VITAIADVYRSEDREIGSSPDVWCVTGSMSISYRRPAAIDTPVTLRASVMTRDGRRTTVACTLSSKGEECARGEVVAVRVPESWRAGAQG
jgi:acyl-CoA thioesterase FadM